MAGEIADDHEGYFYEEMEREWNDPDRYAYGRSFRYAPPPRRKTPRPPPDIEGFEAVE